MIEIHTTDWRQPVRCLYTGRATATVKRRAYGGRPAASVIRSVAAIERPIVWLRQRHGVRGIDLDRHRRSSLATWSTLIRGERFARTECDWAVARNAAWALGIVVADCLPIALWDCHTGKIGLCHAGWRGLVNGILDRFIRQGGFTPQHTRALIGPHICATCFEIDERVSVPLTRQIPDSDRFLTSVPSRRPRKRYHLDLDGLSRSILQRHGVTEIESNAECTRCALDERGWRYPSHRRDKSLDRLAMIIWRRIE